MAEEEAKVVRAPTSSHIEFRDRVRKTLYYGQYSDGSLPSLAVTDVAVEVLSSVVPSKRKCLDTNYAMVVSRRAKISPCTLMMGILYSERLRQGNPDYLTRVSSSDLFLISVMVASKYLYDEGEEEEVFNDDWAKAGSKTVGDVNKMEMEFLASIDWNLFISNEEFLDFVNKVESRVATSLGLCRGWFTYGDLSTLLDNARFLDTLGFFRHEVFKVICACAMAYLFSLSLALSVTTIANRHYHRHSHAQGYISTPVASTPPAPCLTTEAACRFHRPAVIQVASPELQVTVSLTGKERTWTGNGSRRRKATKAGESGSGSRAKKEITNKMHFGAGHSSKNVNAACVERVSFDCKTFSNRLSSNPRNQTERIELVTRGLDISKRSSRLFSIALLKRLLVQQPCRNTPFANSVSLIRAKSNRFFSNSFPARENHDSPLYSTNVNGSLICVS